MTFCVRLYVKNIYVYTQMKDKVVGLTAWLGCMRTGNDEIMNANYDPDDQ